jgi:hypothetical protein
MRSRRIIASLVVCLAASLAAIPAAASAGSLLSGYGGPGEGSQVILGASLVNGPRGGGGSQGGSSQTGGGSTSGGGSATVAATGNSADRVSSRGTGGHSASPRHVRTGAGGAKQVRGGADGGPAGGAATHSSLPAVAAVRPAAEGSDTLGVSGIDLLYILLAVGALVLTAVLTRRIASTSASAEGPGG